MLKIDRWGLLAARDEIAAQFPNHPSLVHLPTGNPKFQMVWTGERWEPTKTQTTEQETQN